MVHLAAYFLLCFLLLRPPEARAEVLGRFRVDPAGTYLVTNPPDRPKAPTAIDLGALGIRAGDLIALRLFGAYNPSQSSTDTKQLLGGVFRGSGQFLAPGQGSIVSPFVSLPSFFGNIPTDISQDFTVPAAPFIRLRVPPGATQILFTSGDSFFSDNTDPNGDLAVEISRDTTPRHPLVGVVIDIYSGALGRAPSDADAAAWLGYLQSVSASAGVPAMIQFVLGSQESRSRAVTPWQRASLLYRAVLGRAPDPAEQAALVTDLLARFNAILSFFTGAPEFQSRLAQGGPAILVTRLYQEVLGRMPDNAEVSAWVTYLTASGDIAGVVVAFVDSLEYLSKPRTLDEHVTILYRALLGRTPNPDELRPWTDYLASQFQASTVGLLGSQEFQARVQNLSGLRKLAAAQGKFIGTHIRAQSGVNPNALSDPTYTALAAREFNLVGPEFDFMWQFVHPSRDRYAFGGIDAVVAFAQQNAMTVFGHTLVWNPSRAGPNNPAWLIQGPWTRDEVITILREHITTIVGRYRGQIRHWIVVNEAFDANGMRTDSFWYQRIGPEYVELAFRWAHEADPSALLFLNDFSGEGLSAKSDVIYNAVQDMLQRGIPIHGVGLQMHLATDNPFPTPEDVAANMERLGALGLRARITEMDVKDVPPVTQSDLSRQIAHYQQMLRVCVAASSCDAFVMEGFTDRYSWINDFSSIFFPGYAALLLFDASYQPRPAYQAMVDVLSVP